ncbi:uncharacterized protein MYCGRDRAFT_74848 [Zymoseptoria tritici IPO323]|uniref:NmrA-like domain-containing protein n=1 Tax=Zymoseptoria tritici (strain CBS 115943 / IPO323) TaxID=336722 RepID=F9XI01_ZYMTI|nr:uncharacterized protein MYCGRDRAFT_74848 [Zymoseptoria tritici IPO323]EGP85324.1 hypothetical protein MYCGRDRAFT_74848 [Zymoseptoria tritici IPO323]
MSSSNRISKVAFVGAGGRSGGYMVDELLKTGKHTVTAITRKESTNKVPDGCQVAKVDYADPDTLVEALRGHDALIITMSTSGSSDQQLALIKAASEAGVKYVLPNEWGPDTAHPGLMKDVSLFGGKAPVRKAIEEMGNISWIGVACGFWYEWSLAIENSYGFDLNNKAVTFFDDGETKTSTSTWAQLGRAVAALLSLPITAEGADLKACLENFKNGMVYIKSFTVSQREMFQSVLRVTGTKEEEWSISYEPSSERYANAFKAMQGGDRTGYVRVMYTRVFYPDGSGDFESSKGTANKLLGLPEEDIDEATKYALERARTNPWG